MSAAFGRCLPGLLSFTLFAGASGLAQTPAADVTPAAAADDVENPHATYPEIVRLSYVEGDVRLSRGKAGEKATGDVWEQAAIDVPMEAGFSVVTGKGRAEIEFEDASTAYLGEDSVLTFAKLTTRGDSPRTTLSLLTGTLTLHVNLTAPGEQFIVRTPADNVKLDFPMKVYLRVNSYLDALALTPQEPTKVTAGDSSFLAKAMSVPVTQLSSEKGHTLYYSGDVRVHRFAPATQDFTAWDAWVAQRVASREAALDSEMKASGLTAPVPGLADLNQAGTFSDCAPYGTCWEPNDSSADDQSQAATPDGDADVRQQRVYGPAPETWETASFQDQLPPPVLTRKPRLYDNYPFPCVPDAIRSSYLRDPLTGQMRISGGLGQGVYGPYRWTVCHTGSWIVRNHRYRWVLGNARHHRCPVHWVKSGRTTGYVPIHPRDVAGKPPVNLEHGFYAVRDAKAGIVEHIDFSPGTKFDVLDSPPRQFQRASYAPLPRAEAPVIEAHLLNETRFPGRGVVAPANIARNAIVFNSKSHGFEISHQEFAGGKMHTSTAQLSGRNGSFQGNGFSGGSRGSGGGVGHGGGHSGGSGGGGGGGSSGGGGGGSHGGGSAGGGGGGSSAGSSGGSHR